MSAKHVFHKHTGKKARKARKSISSKALSDTDAHTGAKERDNVHTYTHLYNMAHTNANFNILTDIFLSFFLAFLLIPGSITMSMFFVWPADWSACF